MDYSYHSDDDQEMFLDPRQEGQTLIGKTEFDIAMREMYGEEKIKFNIEQQKIIKNDLSVNDSKHFHYNCDRTDWQLKGCDRHRFHPFFTINQLDYEMPDCHVCDLLIQHVVCTTQSALDPLDKETCWICREHVSRCDECIKALSKPECNHCVYCVTNASMTLTDIMDDLREYKLVLEGYVNRYREKQAMAEDVINSFTGLSKYKALEEHRASMKEFADSIDEFTATFEDLQRRADEATIKTLNLFK